MLSPFPACDANLILNLAQLASGTILSCLAMYYARGAYARLGGDGDGKLPPVMRVAPVDLETAPRSDEKPR